MTIQERLYYVSVIQEQIDYERQQAEEAKTKR